MVTHLIEYALSKILERDWLRQTTHTSKPDRMRGRRIFDGYKRLRANKPEIIGCGLSHATVCGIGIRMSHP